MAPRGVLGRAQPSSPPARKHEPVLQSPGAGRPVFRGLNHCAWQTAAGEGCKSLLLLLAACCTGPCPAGSWWPVRQGRGSGLGHLKRSAPTAGHLESGCAWGGRKGCGPPRVSRPLAGSCAHRPGCAARPQAQMGTNPDALSPAPSPNRPGLPHWPGPGLSPGEQGWREGTRTHRRRRSLFPGASAPARGCGRRWGSHLGLREHLPALQLAHLDQGGRHAHVHAGGGSDPVAVRCEGGEGRSGTGGALRSATLKRCPSLRGPSPWPSPLQT